MRLLFTIAVLALSLTDARAANFPYIRLNATTNRLSDSGSALTYNGASLVSATNVVSYHCF